MLRASSIDASVAIALEASAVHLNSLFGGYIPDDRGEARELVRVDGQLAWTQPRCREAYKESRNAILRNAILRNAILRNAILRNAILRNAILDELSS